MTLAYISHPDCLKHDVGAWHPEKPERLQAIWDRMISSGFEFAVQHETPEKATREQLERVHDAAYVDDIFARAPREGIEQIDDDTFMVPGTLDAALYAAGAAVKAVDLVMSGTHDKAFCAIRPPGHHAERNRAMGFCFFNNVAVGAAHAFAVHGLDRVAIVDFDVHHGNGTEHIFETDTRVLFCSSFQHPFYPYTGHEAEGEHIVNIPLAAGATGAEFRQQAELHWLPALERFQPQLVMISAGFDGHAEETYAHLRLREGDYKWITRELKTIADAHAGGRMVSTLEGGYALNALGRCVVAHLDAMLT